MLCESRDLPVLYGTVFIHAHEVYLSLSFTRKERTPDKGARGGGATRAGRGKKERKKDAD